MYIQKRTMGGRTGKPTGSRGPGGRGGSSRPGGRSTTRRANNEGFGSYQASRSARYQIAADAKIEYKNLNLLQKYVTDRGKIVSRRMSGISAKQQRALVSAIKIARYLGLLAGGLKRK